MSEKGARGCPLGGWIATEQSATASGCDNSSSFAIENDAARTNEMTFSIAVHEFSMRIYVDESFS
jgi:hypothetical protein